MKRTVERALGMTKNQSKFTFLVESFTIILFGIFSGYLIGISLTSVFLFITKLDQNIAPSVIKYPIEFLIELFNTILGCGVVGTLLPLYVTSKKGISKALRVE